MEQKLTQAFDALHMDDPCKQSIESAMNRPHPKSAHSRPVWRAFTAAACLALVLLAALQPGIARALEDTAERTLEWFRSAVSRGHGITVVEDDYVYYNDGHMEIEVFEGSSVDTSHDSVLAPHPVWLKEQEGRVYFLANMENRDITDLFSQEKPFVYVYEKDGITHYIAIGGNFDPATGLDSIGYSEWLRRTDPNGNDDWLGGSGAGQYDPETDDYALWYARAIVEMKIPWNYQDALRVVENAP